MSHEYLEVKTAHGAAPYAYTLTCGRCGLPKSQCQGVKVTHHSDPLDYSQQMRDWAAANGVKPLLKGDYPYDEVHVGDVLRVEGIYQPNPTITEALKAQARNAFGRTIDDRPRWAYYEEWRLYDDTVDRMTPRQQRLEVLGQCLELERVFSL